MAARHIAGYRSITPLLMLLAVVSQVLLIAHAHRDVATPSQAANCVVCIAAQHASPACANTLPQIEPEFGFAPLVAGVVGLAACTVSYPANQRAPPTPA
jgi:hypothetical protein